MKRRQGAVLWSAVVLVACLVAGLIGCGGSGAGGSGSGTGGDIVDPGSDLINTLWVEEDQGDGDPAGDIVMTIRENGKGVWVEYEDWKSSERSITNGACFTVEFLSDSEMEVTVFAEFKEGSWTAPNPESQPGTMPYGVVNGVMTVGDAAEPEFVVSLIDDGLTDPLRGTSWKYFDIGESGNAQALEFRSDGSMEELSYLLNSVEGDRGIYFLYGLDNDEPSDDTVVRIATEQRESIQSDWTDVSGEPGVSVSSFSFGDGSLELLPEDITMLPTEGDGSLQGNAWLGHEVWIDSGPQNMPLGQAVAPALAAFDPMDVLVLAHTNGSFGFSAYDQWPQEGDLPPERSQGNCGIGDFGSAISSNFEIYAEWYSELDDQDNPLPPDWHASEGSGQSWIAHLGDLFIEQIDQDGEGYALQYVDIGELNPLSGTHWVGTIDDGSDGGDSSGRYDADLVFSSTGEMSAIVTDEGAMVEGVRGRYFVVAPGDMAWWIDEVYNTVAGSWDSNDPPEAWGMKFEVAGTELWAADYNNEHEIIADLQ